MLRYNLYVNLAIEMCGRLINTDTSKLNDEIIWDATLMRFQVLGENIKKIPMGLKNRFPEIKWKNFEWFRDQISHDYRTVFKDVVKSMIEKDLTELKKALEKIKKNGNK
jgi:uncharacterized protein with HEPN domain